MKKKIILLLVLVTLVTGGVFADGWNNSFKFDSGPSEQKGALFLDLSPTIAYLIFGGFGIGLGWEGRINDFSTYYIHSEMGIISKESWVYKNTRFDYGFDFDIEANYRYYFFKSAIDKLFVNGGIGFGIITRKYTYDYFLEGNTGIWTALYLPMYAGYKLIIGPGFVLEVRAGYRIGIGLTRPREFEYFSMNYGGGIYGISVGWAF
jgi:hypothetical protein